MRRRMLACLLLLPLGVAGLGCSSYLVKSKSYLTDLDYAQPKPGQFRYVKRNILATSFWDSHLSPEEAGSPAYMIRMTSLLVQTMKQILGKANLQANQALYNVRISAPSVQDRYFFWAFFWFKSRHTVTISADVIEFI